MLNKISEHYNFGILTPVEITVTLLSNPSEHFKKECFQFSKGWLVEVEDLRNLGDKKSSAFCDFIEALLLENLTKSASVTYGSTNTEHISFLVIKNIHLLPQNVLIYLRTHLDNNSYGVKTILLSESIDEGLTSRCFFYSENAKQRNSYVNLSEQQFKSDYGISDEKFDFSLISIEKYIQKIMDGILNAFNEFSSHPENPGAIKDLHPKKIMLNTQKTAEFLSSRIFSSNESDELLNNLFESIQIQTGQIFAKLKESEIPLEFGLFLAEKILFCQNSASNMKITSFEMTFSSIIYKIWAILCSKSNFK
jgi:hypothetical protein